MLDLTRPTLHGVSLALLRAFFLIVCTNAYGQAVPGGSCRPVSERTQDVGCWILANEQVGELTGSQVFWHLDQFPTPESAETAKTKRSTVVEALGKVWLLTIEDTNWRAFGGEHVATIGPLLVRAVTPRSTWRRCLIQE
jgi:hypothetical protein